MRKAWTAARERWGRMRKRDKYISIAIFSLTWYTVASLTMTALGMPPPDVLTEHWFKAWTTELVVVAGIKIFRKDDTTL